MNFEKSIELHKRSSRSLAGGVSSHHRRGELPVPLFFERAKGSRLFDVDGNEFIDYIMGNGAAIFGHSPDFLLDSVRRMLDRGQIIAGQHDLEITVAELINASVPGQVRQLRHRGRPRRRQDRSCLHQPLPYHQVRGSLPRLGRPRPL